jgi:hypothetical protein
MKPFLSLCKSLLFFVFITLTLNGCSGAISSRQQSTQTITFTTVPSQVVGATVALTATASSGLTVSFASETPLVCTVSSAIATFAATGTCTIQAMQAGNLTYASATPVSQNIAVTSVPLTAQTITFAQPATQTVGTPLTLIATATSGLAVSFASTTSAVCTVSGTTATFLAAGTCTIQATQAGNSTYAAATMVARSFTVIAAATLTAQTITFAQPATQTVGTPLTLTATASSGLTVSFASTTETICTVSGTTATFLAAGTCTIQGTQAGNATYAAATPVSRSFTVQASGVPVIVSFTASRTSVPANTLVTLYFTVTGATTININQGVGDVTNETAAFVTPITPGTVTYTLTATNAAGPATASISVTVTAANPVQPTPLVACTFNGPSPICPPYVYQSPGGVEYSLYGGGAPWAQQLFWQDVPQYAPGTSWPSTGDGYPVPLIGQIGSGVDLYEANGGGVVGGVTYPDYSQKPGYIQYAAWMNARTNLFAMASDGSEPYANQGYITFGMPLDSADWDNTGNWSASNPETFGDWAGAIIGQMCLQINARGDFAADYFGGLNYGGVDWNPRLTARFASWANINIPAETINSPSLASTYVSQNYPSQWYDFMNMGQASYFAAMDKVITAAGKKPMIAAQSPFDPTSGRSTAEYPRLWAQQIPAGDMYFEVENETQADRLPPPDWRITFSIGSNASLAPDVPMGVYMDGDYSDYWSGVNANNWTTQQGWLYLRHMALSAAWTMVANKDGSVRRAAQAFQRGNWDWGTIPQVITDQMVGHIPTHPFGPALYYSQNVMEYFESPNNETSYYYFWPYLERGIGTRLSTDYPWLQPYEGVVQGLNLGYWVSDATDPSTLKNADKPSAWLLYSSSHLPAAELAKLQAVAPVYDILLPQGSTEGGSNALSGADLALAVGPVHATGTGLNMLAFIDQNGSVILMVTNQDATDQNAGSLVFNNVSDGDFNLIGLLGTPSATMTVTNNSATVPISVAAYDTVVYEIPSLNWIGH